MKRKRFLSGAAAAVAATTIHPWIAAAASYNPSLAADDFETLWKFVDSHYCYFGQKTTNWNAAHTFYGDFLRRASSLRDAFVVFEMVLDELYDPHSHLGSNTAHSYRLPSYDIWAEWSGPVAKIKAVRPGSPSASAGLRTGDTIASIGGVSLLEAGRDRTPRFVDKSDPDVRQWVLDSILSGRHDTPRIVGVQLENGAVRAVNCDRAAEASAINDVSWKIVERNVGYIKIPTFSESGAVDAFDKALAELKGTSLLLIDVRENGGGDTAVTRPIMGRFIDKTMPYCRMTRRIGRALPPAHLEFVSPRGPFRYTGTVRVLVDRWTGSAAEGFAMGLEAMGRAIVCGTKMAGLGAAISHMALPYFHSSAQISTEPVLDLDGRSRFNYLPTVQVDLEASGSDPILAAALAPTFSY